MENLEKNYSPFERSFIEIAKKDEEQIKQLLNENEIFIANIFGDLYEQTLKENIEFWMLNEGVLSEDTDNKIEELSNDYRLILVEKATNLLYRNEYLSQTFNECTEDAIEGGLRELFIEKGDEINE